MLRLLSLLAVFTAVSLAHAAEDPEQSWNQAVEQRAHVFQKQQDAEDNAIKIQTRAERIQRALQLASEVTGEPPQAFTYKCVRDCTLKGSGTATYFERIALQSRDKVCQYNAFDDHNEYAVRKPVECLDRVR